MYRGRYVTLTDVTANAMSANNQSLIVEKDGLFYVFHGICAEAWVSEDGVENELLSTDADAVCRTRADALEEAHDLEKQDPTEYGVHEGRLAKDGCGVKLII